MNIKFKEEKGKQNIFIQTNKKQELSFNTYLMLMNNIFRDENLCYTCSFHVPCPCN